MLYDEDRINGKGMHKGLKFLHEKLSGNIRGMRFSEQGKLDWKL